MEILVVCKKSLDLTIGLKTNGMNGVSGHDSATTSYTRLNTTLAIEMIFFSFLFFDNPCPRCLFAYSAEHYHCASVALKIN